MKAICLIKLANLLFTQDFIIAKLDYGSASLTEPPENLPSEFCPVWKIWSPEILVQDKEGELSLGTKKRQEKVISKKQREGHFSEHQAPSNRYQTQAYDRKTMKLYNIYKNT